MALPTISLIATCGLSVVIAVLCWRNRRLSSRLKQSGTECRTALASLTTLDTLLNTIDFPVWRRDEDLTVNCHNYFYEQLLGKDASEDNNDLFRQAKSLAKEAVAQRKAVTVRKHLVIEGTRRLFDITEVPVEQGTIGFAQDITRLEEVEKELNQHMGVQSDLMESSSSAIAIYGADQHIKFYNHAFIALWKLEERWLNSHPSYSEILQRLREMRALPEQADFQQFKKEQIAMFTNLLEKREDFLYLPDERILRVVIIPHEHGGLLFSYEDMTDMITLERSYNTLRSVKSATLDNLFEGVAVLGQDGKLALYNPAYAQMWRLDPAFLKTSPHISDILEETRPLYPYEHDWEERKKCLIAALQSRQPTKQQLERVDNSVLDWACVPLPDGGMLMTYIDVTDSTHREHSLRAQKAALQEADTIKTHFLTNVSYELRSPLTSIKGFSEVLLEQYFGELNDKQREYIQDIYNSSLTLNNLIDNIIDVTSIDAGFMTLDPVEFSLPTLLESIAQDVALDIESKELEFIYHCPEDMGIMLGDAKCIRQAILNLLRNAIRFTNKGGKITLSATQETGEYIIIEVTDTGSGIPPHEQDSVFERFHTIDSNGIGLGLPIAKSFTELHGGTISLQSTVGIGTTLSCRFPRHNSDLYKFKENHASVSYAH